MSHKLCRQFASVSVSQSFILTTKATQRCHANAPTPSTHSPSARLNCACMEEGATAEGWNLSRLFHFVAGTRSRDCTRFRFPSHEDKGTAFVLFDLTDSQDLGTKLPQNEGINLRGSVTHPDQIERFIAVQTFSTADRLVLDLPVANQRVSLYPAFFLVFPFLPCQRFP